MTQPNSPCDRFQPLGRVGTICALSVSSSVTETASVTSVDALPTLSKQRTPKNHGRPVLSGAMAADCCDPMAPPGTTLPPGSAFQVAASGMATFDCFTVQ